MYYIHIHMYYIHIHMYTTNIHGDTISNYNTHCYSLQWNCVSGL